MKHKSGDERRQHARCRARVPYRLVWSGGALTGWTKNLSISGALLNHERVPEDFEEKAESEEITLYLDIEDIKITAKCRTIRAQNLVLSGSTIAVHYTSFLSPDVEEKYLDFVSDKLSRTRR